MPKGAADLIGKISMHQGFFSFYRGTSPLLFMLMGCQTFKFVCNERMKEVVPNQMASSCLTAVVLTTLLYPLDLAHTLMSADMTKKQSLYNQNYKSKNE